MQKLRLAFFITFGLLFMQVAAHAVPIDFVPITQTVELGNQVSVDVVVTPGLDPIFGGPLIVGVYDMIVNWDDSILSLVDVFVDVVFGTSLGGPLDSFQDVIDLGPGSVNVAEASLLFDFTGLQDDGSQFVLFSLVFETIGLGTSSLELEGNILGEVSPFNFIGDFVPIEAEPGSGSITVVAPPVAVPEPGTLLLFLTGLLAVGVLRRKRIIF